MAGARVGNAEGIGMRMRDVFFTAELARLLGIMAPDEFEERVREFAAHEVAPYVYRDAEGNKLERELAAMRAADEYVAQEYEHYAAAVRVVAEAVFGEHGLVLTESKHGGLKVEPEVSWNDAANQIMDTINGVGAYYFSSLREFLESGPWQRHEGRPASRRYTARQAVLSHLHWMRSRSDVYGTASPETMFERQMR